MMAAPKIDQKEYNEKFTTAPEVTRKKKQKAESVESKSQKLGEYYSATK